MAFRFFPPGIQFFTNDGKVLAGGSLTFTDSGTTDPAATYSDPELTTPNPNPVPLDAAGRPENDIWGDGSYRVVLKDADGVVIVTLDDVSGPLGIPDPALQGGKFLSTDGTDIFWVAIREVPDPDGANNGDVLTTDGAGNFDWQPTGIGNVRQVPDPDSVTDGYVLTVDEGEDGGYAWKELPAAATRQWSDVTSSRSLGSTYTNDTGSDIQVCFMAGCKRASAGGGQFTAQCNAITVGTAHAAGSSDISTTITFTVPPEGTYNISNSGQFNGWSWSELRAV